MSQAKEKIVVSAHADVDAARCAIYAGDAAVEQGDVERARSAYQISLKIWEVLGRDTEIHLLQERLLGLS